MRSRRMETERLTEYAKRSAVIQKKNHECLQEGSTPVIVDSRCRP